MKFLPFILALVDFFTSPVAVLPLRRYPLTSKLLSQPLNLPFQLAHTQTSFPGRKKHSFRIDNYTMPPDKSHSTKMIKHTNDRFPRATNFVPRFHTLVLFHVVHLTRHETWTRTDTPLFLHKRFKHFFLYILFHYFLIPK